MSNFTKMKVLTLIAFISISFSSLGQVPPGYYDSAAGLSGPALRQALHDIIDGHSVLIFGSIWGQFPNTDLHPSGRVWDIYSDVPGGNPPYIYQFGIDQCGQFNSEGDCYNREHSFPQSWFNDALPMQSDLHTIYPTDGSVNGKRSNLPYGEVGVADWTGMNGSKTGASSVQGYTQTVFEPIDEYKGDLARTYFYMLTRYKDEAPAWSANTDMLQNGDFAQWAEAMLVQWHLNDPVSMKEVDRNNGVFNAQNNRNPFIDNPQWVESIWGTTASVNELADSYKFHVIGDEIIVTNPAAYGEAFVVYDLQGKDLAFGRIRGERTELPTLRKGVYLLRVGERVARILR